MQVRQWIREAEKAGWRVSRVSGLELHLACSCKGCKGRKVLPLDNLGPPLDPCELLHVKGYAAPVFHAYEELIAELRRRRCLLGLDQGDIDSASGLADGHVAKLESFAKIASPPTLTLWAETLGLRLTVTPAALPSSTLKAIEDRQARPYQHAQARFKAPQPALFPPTDEAQEASE